MYVCVCVCVCARACTATHTTYGQPHIHTHARMVQLLLLLCLFASVCVRVCVCVLAWLRTHADVQAQVCTFVRCIVPITHQIRKGHGKLSGKGERRSEGPTLHKDAPALVRAIRPRQDGRHHDLPVWISVESGKFDLFLCAKVFRSFPSLWTLSFALHARVCIKKGKSPSSFSQDSVACACDRKRSRCTAE